MSTRQISQRYSIYKDSDDLFLTQREAECVAYLLYGLTIRGAAKALGISHRTAEDYISNIREKLDCNSKASLIVKIMESDFKETAATVMQQIASHRITKNLAAY